MTTLTLWQQLKALVDVDNQKCAVQKELIQANAIIDEDRRIIPQLETALTQLATNLITAKKNVDLQELNAKDLKDRQTEKKAALDTVTNQKEYTAVQRELDRLATKTAEQDDILLKAWHELDSTKSKVAKEKIEITEKIDQLKKDIIQKEEALISLKTKIEECDALKAENMKVIPPEWLTRYKRMHNSVPDPIVSVLNESCSACYYSVPPQDLSRLKRGAMLPCRSCYRFLYFDVQEEKESKEESF